MSSAFHLEQESDMLCLNRNQKANPLVEHTGWKIVLRLLLVGVGMKFVVEQRSRES